MEDNPSKINVSVNGLNAPIKWGGDKIWPYEGKKKGNLRKTVLLCSSTLKIVKRKPAKTPVRSKE